MTELDKQKLLKKLEPKIEFYVTDNHPIVTVLKNSNIETVRKCDGINYYELTNSQLTQLDHIMKSGDYNGRIVDNVL